MTALPRAADDYSIRLGDLDSVQFRVVDSPQQWAQRHTLAAVDPTRYRRLPGGVVGAVAAAIGCQAWRLAPLAGAGGPGGYYLHCGVPLPPITDVSVREQAKCIRELPDAMLETEVRSRHGGALPAQWRAAAADPRRWYHTVADASLATWMALGPMLEPASRMFDNEARRVGEAVMRGATAEVLNSLHPRLGFHNGVLHLAGSRHASGTFSLDRRVVALVPMFAGPDAVCVDFSGREVVEIGYPVPGANRLGTGGTDRTSADLLDQILGAARARALRAARRPITAGALAVMIQYAPNTVTYHCDHLERLGLVVRERRGAQVWISRTARGDQLVDGLTDQGNVKPGRSRGSIFTGPRPH
jgi:hypothetical protein